MKDLLIARLGVPAAEAANQDQEHLRGFEKDNDLCRALIRAGAVVSFGPGDARLCGLISRKAGGFQ